jgi:hypothetical protein
MNAHELAQRMITAADLSLTARAPYATLTLTDRKSERRYGRQRSESMKLAVRRVLVLDELIELASELENLRALDLAQQVWQIAETV